MSHRINWEKSNNQLVFNFKWKYSVKGIGYKKMIYEESSVEEKVKIVGLFEYHKEISNKKRMFVNMLEYCNVKYIFLI